MKFGWTATAVSALLLASVAPANATLMISLADSSGDTASASDTSGQGVVYYVGKLGDFAFTLTGGSSKPAIGSPTAPQLDLFSGDVTSAGGTLTLEITDTGFLGNANPYYFVNGIGGTDALGGSLTDKTFLDCSNTPFGMGTPIATQGYGSGAGSASTATQVKTCSGLYSMTEEVVLNFQKAGVSSFDANLAIPEPTTLIVFGVGLVGIGAVLSRRRQRNLERL